LIKLQLRPPRRINCCNSIQLSCIVSREAWVTSFLTIDDSRLTKKDDQRTEPWTVRRNKSLIVNQKPG